MPVTYHSYKLHERYKDGWTREVYQSYGEQTCKNELQSWATSYGVPVKQDEDGPFIHLPDGREIVMIHSEVYRPTW